MTVGLIVGIVCSLLALILAWRAYRGAAEEHERRKRDKAARGQHKSDL